jgi:hypothetical protein
MKSYLLSFNELFGFSNREKQERAFNQLVESAHREIDNFDFGTIFSVGIPDPMTIQSMLDVAGTLLPSVKRLYPDLFMKHWGRSPQMKELGYTDHPLYSKDFTRRPVDPYGTQRSVQNPSSQTAAKINVDYRGNRGYIPTTFNFLVKGGELTSNTNYLIQTFRQELDRHLKYNRDKIIPTIPTN